LLLYKIQLMPLSESQTRQQIIDKRLARAGWNVKDPSQVSEELDIISDPEKAEDPGEKYAGHLFSDYALLGRDGYPLAVVEAKKTSRNAEEGKLQAVIYAENIHKNNPEKDLPFIMYTNGHDIFFWNSQLYPPRKAYGFPTSDDLERLRFLRNNSGTLSEELINTDISGRPYQISAIRSVLEGIEYKRRKFLLVMATGTGKTRTCVSLIDVLMRTNWIQRVLFLVDRIALRDQALDTFREHLPNAPVWPKRERDILLDSEVILLQILIIYGAVLTPAMENRRLKTCVRILSEWQILMHKRYKIYRY
jgi:type I restriction enzyme, R subunit